LKKEKKDAKPGERGDKEQGSSINDPIEKKGNNQKGEAKISMEPKSLPRSKNRGEGPKPTKTMGKGQDLQKTKERGSRKRQGGSTSVRAGEAS